MSRAGSAVTKGALRRISWPAAVVALPVALLAWAGTTIGLTLSLTGFLLGGLIALGVLAAVGGLLLLVPGARTRGAGVGTILTLVPSALVLALSMM